LSDEDDPFAEALESYCRKGRGSYRYTRDDGWSQIEDAWWYFTTYRDFPSIEKQALRFAKGRVLDVGCGAGRHSLYLQRKEMKVTAIDVSERIALISRTRGVQEVCTASACRDLPFQNGQFDTVLLFGNNLGICGGARETSNLFSEIARVTASSGRILATSRAPITNTRRDLAYWNKQLLNGKDFGVARFRLTYRGRHPKWVSLLLVAPTDLLRLAAECGWIVKHMFADSGAQEAYAAVLEKVR
jgi:SAM-dependent methyltransferase